MDAKNTFAHYCGNRAPKRVVMVQARNVETRIPEILLIEDSETDVLLTQEAFAKAGLDIRLHHAENGMAFLRKQGKYANAPTPDLVLLDINMPQMDGREVLAAIARDPDLQHLPVVILTTSSREKDILDMYRLRCSSYIVKPVDFENFVETVRELDLYWFALVRRP